MSYETRTTFVTELRQPTYEEVDALTTLCQKLSNEESARIVNMLAEWSYAVGFANGILQIATKGEVKGE